MTPGRRRPVASLALALAALLLGGTGCAAPGQATARASLKAATAPGQDRPGIEATVAIECSWPGKGPGKPGG